jgi:hypothetical protein
MDSLQWKLNVIHALPSEYSDILGILHKNDGYRKMMAAGAIV